MQNKLEHYICSARFAEQEPLRNGQVADAKKEIKKPKTLRSSAGCFV